MDRSIPMFNRLIIQKMQKQELDLHHQRLTSIKTSYNRKKLVSLNTKIVDRKRLLHQEQKRTEIEKQNIILFNKMNKIMNRQQQRMNQTINLTGQTRHRQQFNNKIYNQNKFLIDRIGNQKPSISNQKLLEDRLKKEKLLKYMGRYPYRLNMYTVDSPPKSKQDSSNYYELPYQPNQTYQEKIDRRNQKTSEGRFRIRSHQNSRDHKEIILLYNKKRVLNGNMIRMEINRLFNEYQFKVIELATLKQYTLSITQNEGNQIFTKCNYDYDFVTSCLNIVNNLLVLDIPKNSKYSPNKMQKINDNTNKQSQINKNKVNQNNTKIKEKEQSNLQNQFSEGKELNLNYEQLNKDLE